MSELKRNFFYKDPENDPIVMISNYLHKERGAFFYFRTMCIRMQERFAQLADHSQMPKVFLHGNPHLENYVKTENGAAMIDFDRSRFGPYAWDLVRLLASIALKKPQNEKKFLSDIVVDYLYEGYVRSFNHADLHFKEPTHIAAIQPAPHQKMIDQYLSSNASWAKKLRENPVPFDSDWVQGVLRSYLESREELHLLDDYFVEKSAQAEGTMLNKRLLILLTPRRKDVGLERILLDVKTVYQDPDNEWYHNPYSHHGIRMIEAAKVYAPLVEERLGYATYNGEQYWGREIPTFAYKIKDRLSVTAQLDIAYSVGTQLGQAHRRTIQAEEVSLLNQHLSTHYKDYVRIAEQLCREILQAHEAYVNLLRKNKNIIRKILK